MSLPTPNLDDRTFKDIVDEAKKKIPTKCNLWTDLNPSDPGITLIELMAWMTEMMIYRLNRLPEKNFIEFLSLMGIKLTPAQPSKTWVVMTVAGGVSEENLSQISSGTRISTGDKTGEPVGFETRESLNPTAARIIRICSKHEDKFQDHTIQLESDRSEGVPIFFPETRVPHVLYLGDSQFGTAGKNFHLKVVVTLLTESLSNRCIEWEFWDGKQWEVVVPLRDDTREFKKSGEIIFEALPAMKELKKKEISGISSYWLRTRLIGAEEGRLPEIKALKKAFQLRQEERSSS